MTKIPLIFQEKLFITDIRKPCFERQRYNGQPPIKRQEPLSSMKGFPLLLTLLAWYISIVGAISNERLLKLSKKDKNVIKLTDNNFVRILDSPRDSDIVVLLTACSPHIGCGLCVEMDPDYRTVADSWFSDHPNGISKSGEGNGLFFARADFDTDTKGIFQHFQVTNVPAMFIMKAGGQNTKDFEQVPMVAELGGSHLKFLGDHIGGMTGVSDLVIYQPINWSSTIGTMVITAFSVLMIRKYGSVIGKILTLRPLWGFVTCFGIITLISGSMFVRIRNAQFAGLAADGKTISYFMQGQISNQFAIESQIITILYSILGCSILGLIFVAPKIQKIYASREQSTKGSIIQLLLVAFFCLVMYIFYSALVAVFILKSPGYPFKLFKNPFK